MQKIDYLIVGQGIAGTLLAWFLEQSNQSFVIIDNGHQFASTKVAAGLINPITGRRFVKSWKIEELLPFAKTTYQTIEKAKGLALYQEVDIVRFFQTTSEANNWLIKTGYEGYEKYLSTTNLKDKLEDVILNTDGFGIVNGAKVAVKNLIQYFQHDYSSKGQLIQQTFDFAQLKVEASRVQYQQFQADKIIFCEGAAAAQNPYFLHLPYESAKGEVLILKIPNFTTDYVIKKNQFLVPIGNDQFWFGSNYEWDNLTNKPTLEGKTYLIKRLSEVLKTDYTIVGHQAAIRPVLKDRRPVLGLHPIFPAIGIFNGLGTKGTSLAPYWADKLVRFLLNGEELDEEVGVNRFVKY